MGLLLPEIMKFLYVEYLGLMVGGNLSRVLYIKDETVGERVSLRIEKNFLIR